MTDILFHTLPTIAVGIAMGFMASFGLRATAFPEMASFVIVALLAVIAFSVMWTYREKRQHGGMHGGRQSRLEASVPLIAGPLSFAVSTYAFWIFPV